MKLGLAIVELDHHEPRRELLKFIPLFVGLIRDHRLWITWQRDQRVGGGISNSPRMGRSLSGPLPDF
jgi:hypothetical protein